MPEMPLTIADIEAAQNAAFYCLNCLGHAGPAFPELFMLRGGENTKGLSSVEQALDYFGGMLRECCAANKFIDRVKTLLVGDNPASFNGITAESNHKLPWELVMELRGRLDVAGTDEFHKLYQPGEDVETVQAKVKKSVEIQRQKQVQVIRGFPLRQLWCEFQLEKLIRHEHDRALQRFQARPQGSVTTQIAPQTELANLLHVLPPQRLTVDLARKTITFDGETYDISSEVALRWVRILAAHANEWISSTDLSRHDPEVQAARTDRWKKYLPDAILSLIDSDTGQGSRIRL